jgi:hypothetical protein
MPTDFPIFTHEVRASLMRQTEAEFMQAFDDFLESELDKRIAAEIAADDSFNAAYRAAKDRAQQ